MQEQKFTHNEWKEMAGEVLASEEMQAFIRVRVDQVMKEQAGA